MIIDFRVYATAALILFASYFVVCGLGMALAVNPKAQRRLNIAFALTVSAIIFLFIVAGLDRIWS